MKAMLKFIAAAACAVALVACGGGDKTPKPVVVVQPDYKVTASTAGTGTTAAKAGDTVIFNYVGYLYDSTKSDFKGAKVESSIDKGVPFSATVGVGAMPAGWDQTLVGLVAGDKRTVVLPSNLAYGSAAREAVTVNGISYPAIPADSPMVYDFEMLTVIPATYIPNVPPPTVTTIIANPIVGTGTAVVNGQTVTVTYTGWLYDGTRANFKGTQFDTNVAGTALTVAVGATSGSNTVIPGFSTALVGMQVGGKRTVIIPPDQGYGTTVKTDANGVVTIPANSTLVFDIQLLTIQ